MMGGGAADIKSLIQGGYEILDCHFAFQQGIDQKGKATTKVQSGTMQITLSQLPPKDILNWALEPRKFMDGMIVLVDEENIPIEKILFKKANCVNLDIDYTLKGNSYTFTKLIIQAEMLVVGSGIEFENEWIHD